jgi:hypothetical protein
MNNSTPIDTIITKIYGNYSHMTDIITEFKNGISKSHNPIINIDDIKPNKTLPYESGKVVLRLADHLGQRKLFLTELQFLTNCVKSLKVKPQYCIYAGSSPGNKTHLLSLLFPDIKFILIDPNKFNIILATGSTGDSHRKTKHDDIVHLNYIDFYGYNGNLANCNKSNKLILDLSKSQQNEILDFIQKSTHKLYIIEDYMSIEFANLFKNIKNTVFISDIRSSVTSDDSPSDFDIIWNTSMMYNWINILQPELSMIKFRMPYFNSKNKELNDSQFLKNYKNDFNLSVTNGIDFIKNYKNKKFVMYKSTLFIQPWPGRTSTEVRSIIYKKDVLTNNLVNYDINLIENNLFYYNTIIRSWFYIKNSNADKNINLCHCNDCAIENNIWINYINLKIQQTHIQTVIGGVIKLDKITKKSLLKFHLNTIWHKWNFNKQADISKFSNYINVIIPNIITKNILLNEKKFNKTKSMSKNNKGNKGKI